MMVLDCSRLTKREFIAFQLWRNPNVEIDDDETGTIFWYDPELSKFMYTKPTNKVRNGIYEARGLMCALRCAFKKVGVYDEN